MEELSTSHALIYAIALQTDVQTAIMSHCWLLCPISPVIVSYALNLLVGQAQVEADALPVSSHTPGNAQQVCLCQVPSLSIAQVQGREGEAIQGTGVLIPAGFQLLCPKKREKKHSFLYHLFLQSTVMATQSPQRNLLPFTREKGSSWGWRVRL